MKSAILLTLTLCGSAFCVGCDGDDTPERAGSTCQPTDAASNQETLAYDSEQDAATVNGTAGPNPPATTYDICGRSMGVGEFERLLQGSLVVAARHRQYGLAPAEAAVGFALNLVLNGIDFGVLGSGAPDFVDGAYVFRNGDAVIGVRFVLTEDVGTWKAGTVISHDVLDPASFFSGLELDTNVRLSLTDPELSAEISFEPGPLIELVDGKIEFDGIKPTSASLRLRTESIAIELVTQQIYSFDAPHENDELTVVMNSTPVPLNTLASVLSGQGLGLVMAGTHMYSEAYELDQLFTQATFTLHELEREPERWAISGPYEAAVKVRDLALFYSGQVHTVDGNWTDVHCDAGRTQLVGRAVHNLALTGGTFRLAGGTSFEYRLEEVPSLEDRVRAD